MNKFLAALHTYLIMRAPLPGKSRSHTKAGPGRMPVRKAQGAPRLQTRTMGSNWQGASYLSYAQHDAVKRAYLESRAGSN